MKQWFDALNIINKRHYFKMMITDTDCTRCTPQTQVLVYDNVTANNYWNRFTPWNSLFLLLNHDIANYLWIHITNNYTVIRSGQCDNDLYYTNVHATGTWITSFDNFMLIFLCWFVAECRRDQVHAIKLSDIDRLIQLVNDIINILIVKLIKHINFLFYFWSICCHDAFQCSSPDGFVDSSSFSRTCSFRS